MLARRILPSLCPLLWDPEPSVRDIAFDVVQSLLNRIFAGHQQWTKSGEEPKAPLDPPKQPTSVMGVTGSYVTSAVSWVAGSIMGKSDATPAAAPAATASSEPPKAVSSSTVSAVLPPQPTVDLSVEELESLGQATKNASLERTESQRDDDMWNESATQGTTTQGATQAWGDDWAENEKEDPKDAVESMGGWGDTDLAFSDDNEEEKEDAYLEEIRQMGKKAPATSQSAKAPEAQSAKTPVASQPSTKPIKMTPMNLDDWAQSLVEEAPVKSSARPKRAVKDVDLTSILGDTTEKKSSGWDDWDEKPAKAKTTAKSSGWDDDWDEKPAKTTAKNSGWDDDDLFASKPAKTTTKSSGWDDWDEKPTKAKTTTTKSSGWDDDWDEKPKTKTAAKSTGWDDDWDEKPAKATTKNSGWDDDDLFANKPAKTTTTKNAGWDDDW